MIDLGNTREQVARYHGDHRSIVQVSDRDRGGQFGLYEVQDMAGTLRHVEAMREVQTAHGSMVHVGSIPFLHYAELLRLRYLDKLDSAAFHTLKMGYLNHANFRKFRTTGAFYEWSPYGWFYELLDKPRELTKFWDMRLARRVM